MERKAVISQFEAMVAEHEGLRVKGKATRYVAVNGNMFGFVDGEGQLCLRLSEADKQQFNVDHDQGDVIQYNSVMRGYVYAPKEFYSDEAALRALFARSVEHALKLKPKPTKKA